MQNTAAGLQDARPVIRRFYLAMSAVSVDRPILTLPVLLSRPRPIALAPAPAQDTPSRNPRRENTYRGFYPGPYP